MKSILSANKKYVIVNIANEWYGTWNGSAWASGYKTAIKNMRNAGIHNLLMVDCAGYMGWSWKGNGETWACLDLANSFDGSSLSDWGTLYSTETTESAKLPRHVRYSKVLAAVLLAVQAVVLPATIHCSGGASWAKVSLSEAGSTNGHRYIKCSYDNCVSAFGTSDFSGKLDQDHVSAKSGNITVYSVCYIY